MNFENDWKDHVQFVLSRIKSRENGDRPGPSVILCHTPGHFNLVVSAMDDLKMEYLRVSSMISAVTAKSIKQWAKQERDTLVVLLDRVPSLARRAIEIAHDDDLDYYWVGPASGLNLEQMMSLKYALSDATDTSDIAYFGVYSDMLQKWANLPWGTRDVELSNWGTALAEQEQTKAQSMGYVTQSEDEDEEESPLPQPKSAKVAKPKKEPEGLAIPEGPSWISNGDDKRAIRIHRLGVLARLGVVGTTSYKSAIVLVGTNSAGRWLQDALQGMGVDSEVATTGVGFKERQAKQVAWAAGQFKILITNSLSAKAVKHMPKWDVEVHSWYPVSEHRAEDIIRHYNSYTSKVVVGQVWTRKVNGPLAANCEIHLSPYTMSQDSEVARLKTANSRAKEEVNTRRKQIQDLEAEMAELRDDKATVTGFAAELERTLQGAKEEIRRLKAKYEPQPKAEGSLRVKQAYSLFSQYGETNIAFSRPHFEALVTYMESLERVVNKQLDRDSTALSTEVLIERAILDGSKI